MNLSWILYVFWVTGHSQISGMINGGFRGLVGSLGSRHPSALSPVPPRARGGDPTIQDSSYLTYTKRQETQAIVSPAPFKSTLQPLCVPHTGHTSSHLGAFAHVPSVWEASLSSSRFKCRFIGEEPPLTAFYSITQDLRQSASHICH